MTNAGRIVLRDWSTAKLPRYSNPPTLALSTSTIPDGRLDYSELYAADEGILEGVSSRKEMRRGAGLVRMLPGVLEVRRPILDAPWAGTLEGNDEHGDAEEEGDAEELDTNAVMSVDDEADSEWADEDSDADVHDATPPAATGKRKRQDGLQLAAPAAKKVAFAAHPKGSKHARIAASKLKPSKVAKAAAPLDIQPTVTTLAKVANAGPKGKKAREAAYTRDGEEAYDFGSFF